MKDKFRLFADKSQVYSIQKKLRMVSCVDTTALASSQPKRVGSADSVRLGLHRLRVRQPRLRMSQ